VRLWFRVSGLGFRVGVPHQQTNLLHTPYLSKDPRTELRLVQGLITTCSTQEYLRFKDPTTELAPGFIQVMLHGTWVFVAASTWYAVCV
jgi:hypothetical protein